MRGDIAERETETVYTQVRKEEETGGKTADTNHRGGDKGI